MATFSRVNGSALPGAFYGLQPRVIVVAATGKFTADSVGGDLSITEGGYSKAVKAFEQFGSIVWLGAQSNNSFAAVVDGGTVNDGDGMTTSGQYGALIDALVSQCGGTAGNYTVTGYTTLAGDGTWA